MEKRDETTILRVTKSERVRIQEKKANATGNIYEEDIRDLQNRQEELWEQARQILLRLSSI
jgi:hypothetical protein